MVSIDDATIEQKIQSINATKESFRQARTGVTPSKESSVTITTIYVPTNPLPGRYSAISPRLL